MADGHAYFPIAVLHVSGIWKRNLKVFFGLFVLYLVTSGVALGTWISAIYELQPIVARLGKSFHICSSSVPAKGYLFPTGWAASLVFDAVVMVFIRSYAMAKVSETPGQSEFRLANARDGTWYFGIIFGMKFDWSNYLLSYPMGHSSACSQFAPFNLGPCESFVFAYLQTHLTCIRKFWIMSIVTSLTWPVNTITLSHLLYRMRGRQKREQEMERYQPRATNQRDVSECTWREETPARSSEKYDGKLYPIEEDAIG
ncbi:hypothetical protein M422DRAFT_42128 [Sphaerobolus stellatus SS14]|nr:hypothetical protein M422DRAFT_42128 [Sphaerobolus stellatus SS14]